MLRSDAQIRARAAALAEEIAAEVRQRQVSVEALEEVLGSALLDVARQERERCAEVADRRAVMWAASARRMSVGSWPAGAVVEARERWKEALALADAIRADAPAPQEG